MNPRAKQWIFGPVLLIVLAVFAFVVFKTVGHLAIRLVYEQRFPVAWCNQLIEGQSSHSLAYYNEFADHAFFKYGGWLLASSILLILAAKLFSKAIGRCRVLNDRVFQIALGALALLMLPPIASRLLATGPLVAEDRHVLWIISAVLFVTVVVMATKRVGISERAKMVLGALLLWTAVEIAFRIGVHLFIQTLGGELHKYGIRTYTYSYAFEGHPFLQFQARPDMGTEDDLEIATRPAGAAIDPHGKGHLYPKPPGVLRVACLGGSTTADGYPAVMEQLLNERDPARRFEVLNYGLGWYDSAHSVINFALNAVHYNLDYVVIHDAWNDAVVRNVPREVFRTDYTHVLIPFHPPSIPDKYLIRASLVYRYARMKIIPWPSWWSLGECVQKIPVRNKAPAWSETFDLMSYESNIEAILQLAQARDIRPVLTTQPYSVAPGRQVETAPHIQQCNELLRGLAQKYGAAILFVDVASAFEGKMDSHFVDLGHLDEFGRKEKARLIADAISNDVAMSRRDPQ